MRGKLLKVVGGILVCFLLVGGIGGSSGTGIPRESDSVPGSCRCALMQQGPNLPIGERIVANSRCRRDSYGGTCYFELYSICWLEVDEKGISCY